MKRALTVADLSAVPLAIALLCAGCSSGKACGLAGAVSGAEVTFEAGVLSMSGVAVFRLCAERRCQQQSRTLPVQDIFFAIATVGSKAVAVTLDVTMGGQSVFSGRTTATTTKLQPNGEGCGPTAWWAQLAAHPGESLTPV
jgi:Mn2+/Fe2+ NRAMP family transporter